jgi:hypothetical protein
VKTLYRRYRSLSRGVFRLDAKGLRFSSWFEAR